MNEHNEAALEDHLEMTWAALVRTKKELDSLKDLRQKFDESEKKNQGLKKSMETCQAEIHHLTQAVESLRFLNLSQSEMMKEMERKMEEGMEKLANKVRTFKRKPLPAVRFPFNTDEIINEPSMSDVHQRPAKTTPPCETVVHDNVSYLSKLRFYETLEEPAKSFSPQEDEIPFRVSKSRSSRIRETYLSSLG